jgi:hypothetical protein
MPEYVIQTTQEFSVTYRVEADSPEGAWQKLIGNDELLSADDQQPGGIVGTFDDSYIEEE